MSGTIQAARRRHRGGGGHGGQAGRHRRGFQHLPHAADDAAEEPGPDQGHGHQRDDQPARRLRLGRAADRRQQQPHQADRPAADGAAHRGGAADGPDGGGQQRPAQPAERRGDPAAARGGCGEAGDGAGDGCGRADPAGGYGRPWHRHPGLALGRQDAAGGASPMAPMASPWPGGMPPAGRSRSPPPWSAPPPRRPGRAARSCSSCSAGSPWASTRCGGWPRNSRLPPQRGGSAGGVFTESGGGRGLRPAAGHWRRRCGRRSPLPPPPHRRCRPRSGRAGRSGPR